MRVFPPNNSSQAAAVTRSGLPPLLPERASHRNVEEINRLHLVMKLVTLAERTRRLGRRFENQIIPTDRDLRIRLDRARLQLVIKLVILAERTRRLGCRFENRTIPADRDLRVRIDPATARLSLRGGKACG